MLTETTKAVGALFGVKEEDRVPNGPLMTGNIEHNSVKVLLSAFLKVSRSSGQEYLNLRIGDSRQNGQVFYGRLFRNTDKYKEMSPDYTGYIELTSEKDGPTLRISGWRKTARTKTSQFISLEIAPPEAQLSSGECDATSSIPF